MAQVTGPFFEEMKGNPSHYMGEIATNPAVFKSMAQEIATLLISTLKQEALSESSVSFGIDLLDAETRQLVLEALGTVCFENRVASEKGAFMLLESIHSAWLSNELTAFDALAGDPEFLEEVRQQVLRLFEDYVLKAMQADSQIAEQILGAYQTFSVSESDTVKSVCYELGPGGYISPSAKNDYFEKSEAFGKSLGIGMATLDAFFSAQRVGLSYICYDQFGVGDQWASHSKTGGAHPSYAALWMVNQYTGGDLMRVDATEVKRINIPSTQLLQMKRQGNELKKKTFAGRKNVPLTQCYAYKKGGMHSFVLYNRSFSEHRTVKLNLPYSPNSKAVLHKLSAASPKDTNRKELMVPQTETVITDFADGYELTLTPAEIVIIVNEEK